MTDALLSWRDEDDALAGEYVLGVLSLVDREAVEARTKADPAFAALVAAWERRLSPLNDDYEAAPAPNLLPRIETCEAEPCAPGAELGASGVDFTTHVVGFGRPEDEGKAVACLAENTGGRYIQAADAGSLIEALKSAVVEPEPEPAPTEPERPAENVDPVVLMVAGGTEPEGPFNEDVSFTFTPLGADDQPKGESYTIYGRRLGAPPQGRCEVITTLHKAEVTQDVAIGPETEMSTPTAVLDAGILKLTLLAETGGEPVAEASRELRGADGHCDLGYAKALLAVPSGEHALSARLGEITVSDSVVITA